MDKMQRALADAKRDAAPEGWNPMKTAPRDGRLFDMIRNGIRHTDCHIDEMGRLVKVHSYPSVTRWFLQTGDGWLPRPIGLVMPYETNADGFKYIPSDTGAER